jgi:hypothetical protein
MGGMAEAAAADGSGKVRGNSREDGGGGTDITIALLAILRGKNQTTEERGKSMRGGGGRLFK